MNICSEPDALWRFLNNASGPHPASELWTAQNISMLTLHAKHQCLVGAAGSARVS